MKPAGDAAEEKLADLVRQAKRGSREAFMELYKLFYHELYAYASYIDRKSTRLNSSHSGQSRMPSSA